MTVSIRQATESLNEGRKAAAGSVDLPGLEELTADQDPTVANTPAYLAGLDLDLPELLEYGQIHGYVCARLVFTRGPITAGSTVWVDGLMTGLELARLRRREEGVDARLRALAVTLETVKRILIDGAPLEAPVVRRALTVIDLMLEGEAEDAT